VDLHLFGRVLWRFKYVVAGGFTIAVLLAIFTVAKLDFHGVPHLAPRKAPIYQSSADLLVTEAGFPWGSAVQTYTPAGEGNSSPTGDLGRLTSLANLYAEFANGDQIEALAARKAPHGGTISATQMFYTNPALYTTPLPIVTITGSASTPANAIATARAGVDALMGYLTRQQSTANIPSEHRVVLQEIRRPDKTTVANPPKKTLPIVVFLTVMLAVIGLAFVLENLRPVPKTIALRADADQLRAEAEPLSESARRSA